MNKYLLLFLISLPFFCQAQTTDSLAIDTTVYSIVEQMPEFEGGFTRLSRLVSNNLIKEKSCEKRSIGSIKVFLAFIIEPDSSMSNIKYQISGQGEGCFKLNISDLTQQAQDKWIPGRHLGKIVRVRYRIPIHFHFEY